MSEIWQKLARAQSKMGNPRLDKVNPRFNTKYATLASVINCVRGPLNEEGLFMWNETVREDGMPFVVTKVTDGTEVVELGMVEHFPATDPQKNGSALTYSKRYSICAAFGIVGEEDDDGNTVSQEQPKRANQQQQRPLWDRALEQFYAKCEAGGFEPGAVWAEMVNELGFQPTADMSDKQLAPMAQWIAKMQG